jgi:hypothetical protein
LRFFKYRIYFMNHPDLIEDVLLNQARKFAKVLLCKRTSVGLARACSPAKGEFWLRQRRSRILWTGG